MSEKCVIRVSIERKNGWFIATSPDMAGLIVCHQSYLKLASEIPECIKMLFRIGKEINVDVEELLSMGSNDPSEVVFEAIKRAA